MKKKTTLRWAWLMAGFIGLVAPAMAQSDYPSKPIRLVVPWSPGSATDAASRMIAQSLSLRLGKTVIVDNRPGANGQIGANIVAKSAPDGYTLLVGSAEPLAIDPEVYKSSPYDPMRDFVGVRAFAINPFFLVARPDFPANSVKELVELVKKSPKTMTFGSWGVGSTGQIAMEIFKARAGIDLLHVPFNGGAPALTALMGGQIDFMISAAGPAAHVSSKIKILAATTQERSFILPNIPTLKEEGYGNVDVFNWFGIVAPSRTPPAILEKLSQEIDQILKSNELKIQYKAMGLEVPQPMSRDDFNKFIATELIRWGEVVKKENIQIE